MSDWNLPEYGNCSECGTSNEDCLDTINRVNGWRCCDLCGLAPVHESVAAVSHG